MLYFSPNIDRPQLLFFAPQLTVYPFYPYLSSFSWGCFFFWVFSRLSSPIRSNSFITRTVTTPPMKPNKVLQNNSPAENISQSLPMIGNRWNSPRTTLKVFSLRIGKLRQSCLYIELVILYRIGNLFYIELVIGNLARIKRPRWTFSQMT